VPAMDIPTVGRFSVVEDAQGARFAPFRPETEAPEVAGPPGLGTFCWNELVTQDPEAASRLYADVFGYGIESKPMGPMGTYTLLKRGEAQAAGIMKAMEPKAGSFWLGYVVVDDVDQSFARAQKLGGKAMVSPADIPDIGRFAVVLDPKGASIALFKG
jgi:predicted enzyme related to lactoylglutathione lyase